MASKKKKKSNSTKSKVATKFVPPKKGTAEREHGPAKWFLPTVESTYTKLKPHEAPQPSAASRKSANGELLKKVVSKTTFRSALQPERGEEVLGLADSNLWRDRLSEYKKRKAQAAARPLARLATRIAPTAPTIAGATNWSPLGPSVVMNGQAKGEPPIAGRVSGVAVAPGGLIVYAASANGGVFRSDDGGVSWKSLMDGFDLAPTAFATTSLACGAIAIDPSDPNRVYVGTGEGDTYSMFKNRLVNALPAYRGVGPIRSDDGGTTWIAEATAPGSTELAGQAFFALAVDPSNRENVIGATSEGLYQRVAGTTGTAQWVQRRKGAYSSVRVTVKNGAVLFFAADWGGKVWQSSDGSAWTGSGTGFPASDIGRIALAVQQLSPDVVYAFVANSKGALKGIYRMDGGGDHGRTLLTRRMCCRLMKMEAAREITIWLSR